MLKNLTTSCFLLFSMLASGQSVPGRFDFDQTNHIKIVEGSDTLAYGWAGGLNYVLAGNIDLDLNGGDDLLIFDKNAQRLLPFVTHTENGQSHYVYAPEYEGKLPQPQNWLLVADYNCDGKKDLFFNSITGIKVWENTSSTELSFQPAISGTLQSLYSSGRSALYVSSADLPAITDVDDDGDLDILTFTNGGSEMEFHENKSSCGLDYELKETCWGYFQESGFYRSVELGACTPYKRKKGMHSGSTILSINLDGDNDNDLLLGNVSFEDITALYNGGTKDSTHFTSQDTLWPRYDSAVFIDLFPALSYVDVNFDNTPDLIASPYVLDDGSQNRQSVTLYDNTGSTQNPTFDYVQPDFLQGEMVDLGAGAVPRLVDLSGDSLLDLVISNKGSFVSQGVMAHYYYYYKNTGTATQPRFELVDTDLAGISSLSTNGLGNGTVPAFGDLNNDGIVDMMVGDEEGQLHYFTNSDPVNPSFSLQTAGFGGIDVGRKAAPFLYDLDDDGDLDMLIGNEQGKIYYYKNSSATSPSFTKVTDFFGAVNTSDEYSSTGEAVPYIFKKDSVLNLFVGSGSRGILQYDSLAPVSSLPPNIIKTLGQGSIESSNFEETPFGISKRSGRNQFLIRADELKAAGLGYGYITGFSFDITTTANDVIYRLSVRIKSTTDSVLTGFATNDFTNVRTGNIPVQFPTDGWQRIDFEEPYLWDGSSNLIVEMCYRGQTPGYDIHLNMTDVGYAAHAVGDITGYNSLTANGCAMPYKKSIQLRPNLRIDQTPSLVEFSQFSRGRATAPAIADLDNDGYVDMIVGTFGGGVTYFKGKKYTISLPEEENLITPSSQLGVFPNPGTGRFTIESPMQGKANLLVYDLNGKIIMQKGVYERFSGINLEGLPAGIYLFILENGKEVLSQKVIKR